MESFRERMFVNTGDGGSKFLKIVCTYSVDGPQENIPVARGSPVQISAQEN